MTKETSSTLWTEEDITNLGEDPDAIPYSLFLLTSPAVREINLKAWKAKASRVVTYDGKKQGWRPEQKVNELTATRGEGAPATSSSSRLMSGPSLLLPVMCTIQEQTSENNGTWLIC